MIRFSLFGYDVKWFSATDGASCYRPRRFYRVRGQQWFAIWFGNRIRIGRNG